MTTQPPAELDPIGYVRAQLATMNTKALTRLAVDADVAVRTVYNIKAGRDARYDTVIHLRDILRKAEADKAPAKPARKRAAK